MIIFKRLILKYIFEWRKKSIKTGDDNDLLNTNERKF
jgi:hypothetical protein